MKFRSLLSKVAVASLLLGTFARPARLHADIAIFQDGLATPFLSGTYSGIP